MGGWGVSGGGEWGWMGREVVVQYAGVSVIWS